MKLHMGKVNFKYDILNMLSWFYFIFLSYSTPKKNMDHKDLTWSANLRKARMSDPRDSRADSSW